MSDEKITSATPEQWAEIEKIKEQYLEIPKVKDTFIRATVRDTWKRIGEPEPQVEIHPSPTACVDRALILDPKNEPPIHWSIWWRAWAGWYRGAEVLGVKFDKDALDAFDNWTACVPFCCPYREVVLVSRWPTEVHWRDRVLHNEEGMSVMFADGTGIWTLGGIPVDEEIVMRPKEQKIADINGDQNQDRRAIRIERYGWPEYLQAIKAKLLDQRKNEVEGTVECLYQVNDTERRLVATCPTGRIFAMGVPGEIETCIAAQEWLAGKKMNVIART